MPRRTIGTFEVEHLEILGPDGTLDADLEPELGEPEALELYRAMVLAREVDQRMLKLQRQGRIGTFPLCTGQEASACAPVLAMRDHDWLVPAFREVGALLMRGVGLQHVLGLYAGYEEGCHTPDAPRTLPNAIPVGSQIPHAAGLGHAMTLQEDDAAVVCFFGDGATSEGDFHEAVNFAGVWKAPVVFLCQNNHWAISLPTAEQTASATIAQKAVAYGVHGLQVDGNDPLAVYAATAEALQRARAGEGPTLIEAVTYRLMQHTTSDDPRKYRADEEVDAWWARDPIPRFRGYLEARGLWDDDAEEGLQRGIKEEIDAAVAAFEATLDVPPDTPFEHVFAEQPPGLAEQHAAFRQQAEEG